VSDPVAILVARLRSADCKPRRSGEGWAAHCPSHEDSTQSLSLSVGADGRVLVRCHAGCSYKQIVDDLGMAPRDLFARDCPAGQARQSRPFAQNSPAVPAQDWAGLAESFVKQLSPEMRDDLSRSLGVSEASLAALRVGWATAEVLTENCGKVVKVGGYTFPMMSGAGGISGINVRTHAGRKWTLKGAKLGLFVPSGLASMPDPVYCPEGASDTAAALDRGCAAVGRPSSCAGIEHLAGLLRGRRVVIVGENDQKADRWSGRDGAMSTAAKLAREWSVRVVEWILPPDGMKDLRAWHHANPGKGIL